jgi:starvation-inducible DNA-binding protein
MKPTIEISDNHLKDAATLLNKLLANEYILYTKTRRAHWNIEGPNFIGLHLFFQSQYEELDGVIDDVAERVRSLGHFAVGSLRDFLEITDMLEDDEAIGGQSRIIKALADDHETIIRTIRNEITTV